MKDYKYLIEKLPLKIRVNCIEKVDILSWNKPEETFNDMNHLLNYCATSLEVMVKIHHSDVILHVYRHTSYLLEPKVFNRLGGGLLPNPMR